MVPEMLWQQAGLDVLGTGCRSVAEGECGVIPIIEWSRDHRTAIHEAGHVVAARVLGRAVDWVAIYPANGGGCARIAQHRDVNDITVYAAGITAEHLNWPGKPDHLDTGAMESGSLDRDAM